MNKSNPIRSAKLPLILSLVSVISMVIGMRLNESLVSDGYLAKRSDQPAQRSIHEVSEHIQSKYYGEISDDQFTDAVIDAMVTELDPHSHYFPPERSARYDRYMSGLYRGVGIEFITRGDTAYIFNVLPGSPAADVGLKRGQIVAQIDSVELLDSDYDIDSMLRVSSRELGDEVEISVLDADYGLKQVSVTVSEVEVPLINHYVVTAEDSASVSIVRIKRFYEDVYRDFMRALEDQKTMGYNATHLIIDLRDNPGGIVEETVKILNQLIPEKQKLLLSTNKKSGRAKEYLSNGRTFLDIERIVIICNEASASASEILAGVLQDYDRGVVIGLPSYGKGLIQQNYDLSNDGSINLSIGEYILPSGRHIHPSSMTDSTYQSLVNTRSLSAGRGVPPDVLLEDCVMRIASTNYLPPQLSAPVFGGSPLDYYK